MKITLSKKKIVTGVLFGLDVLLSLFFLLTSIVMIVTLPDKIEQALGHYPDNYIGFLQQNPDVFKFLIVLPMVMLFMINAVVVILYFLKTIKKEPLK